MTTKHEKTSKLVCPECSYEATTKYFLKKHIAINHSSLKKTSKKIKLACEENPKKWERNKRKCTKQSKKKSYTDDEDPVNDNNDVNLSVGECDFVADAEVYNDRNDADWVPEDENAIKMDRQKEDPTKTDDNHEITTEVKKNTYRIKEKIPKRIKFKGPAPCPYDNCDFIALKKVELNRHRKGVHGDVIPRKKPAFKDPPKLAVSKGVDPKEKRIKEKKFSCEVCGAKATSMWYITRHMRLHTGEKPFICEYPGCTYQSYRKYHLTRHHQNIHSTLRPYTCEYCEYSTKVKENLRQHIISKHTTSDHFEICQFCDYKTKLRSSLRSHVRKVHQFTCKTCVWEFGEELELVKHLDRHKESGILCDQCSIITKDIEELKSHSLSEHNFQLVTKLMHISRSSGRQTCETCQYQFPSTQMLEQHKSYHTENGFITCNVCGHIFKEMKELLGHTVVQHGFVIDAKLKRVRSFQPKFCCSLCKYEFKSSSELQTHSAQHRLDDSLKCASCSNTFQTMPDLMHHCSVIHNKILDGVPILSKNVIQCQLCNYMFPSLSKLNAHKRKHLPDGTILCFHCPVNLNSMDEMKLHMTLMHGINIEATRKSETDVGTQNDLNRIFALSCKEQVEHLQRPYNASEKSLWCSICFYKALTPQLLSSHLAEFHNMPKFLPSSNHDITYKSNMNQLPEVSQTPGFLLNQSETFGNNYINSYIKLPINTSCTNNNKVAPLHHNISENHHPPSETTNIDDLLRLEFLSNDNTAPSLQKDHQKMTVNNVHNVNNIINNLSNVKVPACISDSLSSSTEIVVDIPQSIELNEEKKNAFPGVFV